MTELLIRLLNMSVTAGCIVLAVLAARLLMRRLPKGFSYALWLVVLFRFLCPVVIASPLSLLPRQQEPISHEIITEIAEPGESVFEMVEGTAPVSPAPVEATEITPSVRPVQRLMLFGAAVWMAGALCLLIYWLQRFRALRRRLSTAIRIEPGIYESDQIAGAFVMGIVHPRVYLPAGLEEPYRRYVLCHERAHIKRGDYLVKAVGLLMVVLHWFNPLAWLSFHYLSIDMEMACDEQVVRTLGTEERKSYSLALLRAAEIGSGLPLPAFAESSTKLRIKNILTYRKPRFVVSMVLAVLLLCAGIGLITNPPVPESSAITIIGGADGPTSIFLAGKVSSDGAAYDISGEAASANMPDQQWLDETRFLATFPGEKIEDGVSLDIATEDSVIFHGPFGLFAFREEDGQWQPELYLPGEEAEQITEMITRLNTETNVWSEDSIHPEDRLRGPQLTDDFIGDKLNEGWQDFDARKMANGKIAVLGGYTIDGTAKVSDLFYGFYDPEEQVFHQVYLFMGNGTMFENNKGQITRQRHDTADSVTVQESEPGALSADAVEIERIAGQVADAYFTGDREAMGAHLVGDSSEELALYQDAGTGTNVPLYRIHGLYGVEDAELNDTRQVWCSFYESDRDGIRIDESMQTLEMTFVKMSDGWKLEAMELS